MSGRRFPVLGYDNEWKGWTALGMPRTVPWELVAPHENQALANHAQTLMVLASRGGLSPAEILAMIEGRGIRTIGSDVDAIPRLLDKIMEVTR